MEIELTIDDIKEIEKNMQNFSDFLLKNFCSFSAAAFMLQSVLNAVDEAKTSLAAEE